MTSQLSVLLKKYSLPMILLITGLIMLILGVKEEQESVFMIASVMMLLAGFLSILYSSGKLKPMIVVIVGVLAGIGAIITLAVSYKSVSETSEYNDNYKYCKDLAKKNLEDIRFIQKVYFEQNGVYLSTWEELIEFTNTGTIPRVDAQGVVPSRKIDSDENNYLYVGNPPVDNMMTEEEAYRLSLWKEGPNWSKDFASFRRDTIQVSLLENKFKSKAYRMSREKQGFYTFSPDSLPIIPFTKEMWKLETLDSLRIGEEVAPVIMVSGMIPFADIQGKNDNKEEMFFGSITTFSVDGSWEIE